MQVRISYDMIDNMSILGKQQTIPPPHTAQTTLSLSETNMMKASGYTMKRENLYLSTIDSNAHRLAYQHKLGLEIAEFCTAWNLDDQLSQTDQVVREKQTCSNRFVLHGPFSELFPCAIDLKVRAVAAQRYRQTIQAARRYGINKIVLHAGYNPYLYYPCWFTEKSIQFWQDFMAEVPDDMVICLENVLEEEPKMLADIVRSVNNPKLRMCLDVGHANVYSKNAPLEWVNDCADLIAHFHIHNNSGAHDSHSALDCGTIPMVQLLEAIDISCPTASITLELEDSVSSLQWLAEKNFLDA